MSKPKTDLEQIKSSIFYQELLRYMITQLHMVKQMFTWADKRDKEELGFAAWDGTGLGWCGLEGE